VRKLSALRRGDTLPLESDETSAVHWFNRLAGNADSLPQSKKIAARWGGFSETRILAGYFELVRC